MREKVGCIYSSDETFAVKLAEYINSRHLLSLQVIVYTQKEAALKSVEHYETEILIADVQEELEWFKDITDTIVYLNNGYEDTENSIAKYQSADKLVKKIMARMTGFRTCATGDKRTRIGCIYSPASKCFKTTLALSLGLWSAKEGKSLFINLEQFAGLNNVLSSAAGGLSQALYHYKVAGRQGLGKIIACTDELCGMEYFYPVTCAEDLAELENKEFIDFLSLIIESNRYEYIWIDVGNVYANPWKLMEVCDEIIVPNPLDYVGRRKVSQMENYLVASGRAELLSKFRKVELSYNETFAGYDINCEMLLRQNYGQEIKEILRG